MTTPPGLLPAPAPAPKLGGAALSTGSRDTSFDESLGRRYASSMAIAFEDLEDLEEHYETIPDQEPWLYKVCCSSFSSIVVHPPLALIRPADLAGTETTAAQLSSQPQSKK